jgi:Ca2+-binding EF-hand superfamily protein
MKWIFFIGVALGASFDVEKDFVEFDKDTDGKISEEEMIGFTRSLTEIEKKYGKSD